MLFFEKTKFEGEVNVAFFSDAHCGSDRHLGKSLNKFIDWLGSEDEVAKKIKYIFLVGILLMVLGYFQIKKMFLD
jgi:DNA polymerase II small subunit/DNA polymerase delta subunit B